ncbi:MAG TPA: Omp28-related outer membrane protein [Crocinitomix sp.]|nr:Omp28-related outer membrane protein [Crocinitomix sp.]
MKNILLVGVVISGFLLTSCDKVEQPVKPSIDIDTTLYTDGNWADYPWPQFPTNTNTDRNILIEDYTGHKCPNCPAAAIVAKSVEDANPNRVFVVSIHAGAAGDNSFQALDNDCGTNPNAEFCTDFTTPEGTAYGIKFGPDYGFFGNPFGNVSRYTFNGTMFQFHTEWQAKTDQLLTQNDLQVNMQAVSNFYPQSNGIYLHVQSHFLNDLSGNYNIVTYVVDNEVIDWQIDGTTHIEFYHHHNVFLGCIDGSAWGHTIATDPKAGDIVQTDYAYQLPVELTTDSIHFLSYVYNVDTYEILQVIKHNP